MLCLGYDTLRVVVLWWWCFGCYCRQCFRKVFPALKGIEGSSLVMSISRAYLAECSPEAMPPEGDRGSDREVGEILIRTILTH